jgi:N-methylhydantoinase B
VDDPVRLEIFKQLFASVAEEMGMVLRRTAFSPNIKERRDFSCAVFDPGSRMIAQASHIPVHLGAMPLAVASCIESVNLEPGDIAIVNDPYRGGTHLPDITLVSPVFLGEGPAQELVGYVANRAHHADVGGMTPGSMPLSRELYQEGIIIPPIKLVSKGDLQRAVLDLVLANVRTPEEREGDLRAQIAANAKGAERLAELVGRHGMWVIREAMGGLLAYAERMTRRLVAALPDGRYTFLDVMDDDGIDAGPAEIRVSVTVRGDELEVDFTGTSPQRAGSINAVYAITLSAVLYVVRSLIGLDIPSNSGCLAPVRVIAPEGSLVNALPPAAVAGGNVETSQRIVDVLLGAFAQACPERVPAASQGTMNNVTIGGWDEARGKPFTYYETIGGGMGARPGADGASGIHSHMTNTLNTPIEALEYAYPLRLRQYGLRPGSGGEGRFRGGEGIIRETEILAPSRVTLLSERRIFAPYGLAGGEPGQTGRNVLIGAEGSRPLPGKTSLDVKPGDVLRVETPGGGGWG